MPLKPRTRPVPFYFGSADRRLFGCFHEPPDKGGPASAVLICQPVGHEYINSHRALRQLALGLTEAGFPVLRFDYFGCGDSLGDADQGSITRWIEDISTAVSELRTRSGMFRVSVVGLRLGATLAAFAGSLCEDFDTLVLWEPIVKGKDYLDELIALDNEMLRFRPKPKRLKNVHAHIEILGFPLSRMLQAQLEELDLTKIEGRPARRVLVMRTAPMDRQNGLKAHLIETRTQVEDRELRAPEIWLPTQDGSLLVPAQVLQSLVSWVRASS